MSRIDRIIKNELFLSHLKQNSAAEADRSFCRHDMAHFLDVARIAMIINLEERLEIPKDIIYAAALLHDVGRHEQYESGTPHELASFRIAPGILRESDYSEEEINVINEAICSHRDEAAAGEKNLKGLLYRADKASRACFICPVEKQCNWKGSKKNMQIYL